ncbi:MAG: VWA domain-containing protein [Synergistaceae bacterium]|nr:VWA domain-containing protein [Synergistaceae bacterium]
MKMTMWRKAGLFLLAACIPWAGVSEATGVVFEVETDTPVVQAQKRQRVIVRALVRPDDDANVKRRRVPLAAAVVLDRSGSMSSDGKMENAKAGALEALGMLDGRDVASVVVYDSEASVAVLARPVSDMKVFSRAISRIRPEGSTALYDGVRLGAEQLRSFVKEGYVPRIILLSDGIANVGPASTRELATLGRALAERGMTITTIGLGLDYNEDLMTALASESGGNAYFARHADSLTDIFARDMEDALALTAREVRISLTCGDGVRPIGTIGRPAAPRKGERADSARSIEVSIDNLYGAEKYALFEIEIPESPDSEKSLEAATLRLEYLDPETGRLVAGEAPLRLVLTEDGGEVEKNRRVEIVSQTEIARNAEIREEVVRLADEGRADEASTILRERGESLRQFAPAAGAAAPTMNREAKEFESLAEDLRNRGRMDSSQRKESLNKAYIQKNQQSENK